MRHLTLKAALLAAMIGVGSQAYAVPAYPQLHKVRQADGSVIEMRMVGDEHYSYFLSPDNYPMVLKDGNYYYARPSEDASRLVASSYRAAAVRDAATNRFLASLNKDDIRLAVANQVAEARDQSSPAAMMSDRRRAYGLMSGVAMPHLGAIPTLVVLVEFPDRKFQTTDPTDYFTRMLNETGFSDYGATGSVKEYFNASSFGKFDPTFEVVGPIMADKSYAYYGLHSGNNSDVYVKELVREIAEKVDALVDFNRYDFDQDGDIDNLALIYAGWGEASSDDPNKIGRAHV